MFHLGINVSSANDERLAISNKGDIKIAKRIGSST
jgi:hypothetical protein